MYIEDEAVVKENFEEGVGERVRENVGKRESERMSGRGSERESERGSGRGNQRGCREEESERVSGRGPGRGSGRGKTRRALTRQSGLYSARRPSLYPTLPHPNHPAKPPARQPTQGDYKQLSMEQHSNHTSKKIARLTGFKLKDSVKILG